MTVIKVDYAALENASMRINQISGMLDENLTDLRSRLQRLNWEGEDRVAYNQFQAQWDTAVSELNTLLAQIGGEVSNAKTRFVENELRGAKRWAV